MDSGRTTAERSTRRAVLTGAVGFSSLFLSGCAATELPRGRGTGTRADVRRQDIIERYTDGRLARRLASESWAAGRDAWQLHYFRRAAQAWGTSGDHFETSRRRFDEAVQNCATVGAQRGREICTSAREYCRFMQRSATTHAEAASAYAAGEFDRGDRHLETGLNEYISALEFEIKGPSHLREALDADLQMHER